MSEKTALIKGSLVILKLDEILIDLLSNKNKCGLKSILGRKCEMTDFKEYK